MIEGVAQEEEREVLHIWDERPTEDEEDREVISQVYIAALPRQSDAETSNVRIFEEEDWFASASASAPGQKGLEPSWRLSADGIQRVSVEAIRLKSTSVPVRIEEWRDDPQI